MQQRVEQVQAGICPTCGHPLTDPAKSKVGWYWCRNPQCRKPWKLEHFGIRRLWATSPSQFEIETTRRQLEEGREE